MKGGQIDKSALQEMTLEKLNVTFAVEGLSCLFRQPT